MKMGFNEKELRMLPRSLSEEDRWKCALFLAKESSRFWLAGFFEQLIFNEQTGELYFNLSFIEDMSSHYPKKMNVVFNDYVYPFFQHLKAGRMIQCKLCIDKQVHFSWIYGIDLNQHTFSVLMMRDGEMRLKELSFHEMSSSLFDQHSTLDVWSFCADKPNYTILPHYLKMQTYLFLQSEDMQMLYEDGAHLLFGMKAVRRALLDDLKKGRIKENHRIVLQDHLRFVKYRLALWKTRGRRSIDAEKQLWKTETAFENLEKELTFSNVEAYCSALEKLHKEQYDFLEGETV